MFLGTHLTAFGGSVVAPATIEAYLATEYRVDYPAAFVLVIGRRHLGLRSLLQGRKRIGAAVLTAWNPCSRRRSKSENRRAQDQLIAELDRRQLPHFQGHGVHPQRAWPAEESCLVLGIDLATSASLGRQFRQNAIVWSAEDGLPLLAMLR